jgi:hypothetical protein
MKKIVFIAFTCLFSNAFGQFTGGGTTNTAASNNSVAGTDMYVHFGYSAIRGNLQNLPNLVVTEWFGGPAGLNMQRGFNFGLTMAGTYPDKKVAFVPLVELINLGFFPIDLKSVYPTGATKSGTPVLMFNQFYGFGFEINAVKDLRIIPNAGFGWGMSGGTSKYAWESNFAPIMMSTSSRINYMGLYFNFGYGLHLAYKDYGFSLNYVQGKSHFLTFTAKSISDISVDGGITYDQSEALTEYSKVKMPMRYIEFRFLYRFD